MKEAKIDTISGEHPLSQLVQEFARARRPGGVARGVRGHRWTLREL